LCLGNCDAAGGLGGELLASFLKSPGARNVFLAGLFTGMLPCGLVYAFVALAASTGDLLRGAAVMAVFGLGTAPVMVLSGCGASILNQSARCYAFRVAAWCVILTGVVSIARGCGFFHFAGWEMAGCPLCHECKCPGAGS